MISQSSLKKTTQEPTGRHWGKIMGIGFVVIALLTISWNGFNFMTSHWVTTNATVEIRNLIVNGLQNTSELTTVRTSSKATIVVYQPKKLLGMPLGDTNLVYEGVGTIRAGIDLMQIEARAVDMNKRSIHLTLPPPHIGEVGLDVTRSSVLANFRHWFAPSAGAEMQELAQHKAIHKIKAEACANHILDAANTNAKQLIEKVLSTAGYQHIEIDTQFPQTGGCSVV
jgi:hypothetical protein